MAETSDIGLVVGMDDIRSYYRFPASLCQRTAATVIIPMSYAAVIESSTTEWDSSGHTWL